MTWMRGVARAMATGPGRGFPGRFPDRFPGRFPCGFPGRFPGVPGGCASRVARTITSSAVVRAVHMLDTRKFAVQLEREGFTPAQADAILKSLTSVLNDTSANLNSNLVSRDEFLQRVYEQKVDFTKLKSELSNLGKAEATRISDEQERLWTDVEKSRQQFRETVAKERANVRLDFNLEKGRVREESAGLERKIQDINARIDQELGNFKTQIQGTKVQVVQWLIGVCTGTFALVLAYIRLLS